MPLTSGNLWVFKTVEADDRSYISNDGYEDLLTSRYNYDSNVGNHTKVKAGDLVILTNKKVILGYAKIEKIDSSQSTKQIRRCPIEECGNTTFEARKTKSPKYRCNKGHEFSEPIEETVPVTKYEAHYGYSYRAELESYSIETLKEFYLNGYNRNMSIQRIDSSFIQQLESNYLAELIDHQELDNSKYQIHEPEGAKEYQSKDGDHRQKVSRQIAERRGQKKFRDALLARFQNKCCITGCSIVPLLEAAHINAYRGEHDNHPKNGLLLRADIHTLFDLNLIGIEPETLNIFLNRQIDMEPYKNLHGSRLPVLAGLKPDQEALKRRWKQFQKSM